MLNYAKLRIVEWGTLGEVEGEDSILSGKL
jgi:hypothetical protein